MGADVAQVVAVAQARAEAGDCTGALESLAEVRAVDAEAARVAIVSNPWLAGCSVGKPLSPRATVPAALPVLNAPAKAHLERCDDSIYLEPAFLLQSGPGSVLTRIGLGGLVRACSEDRTDAVHIRLGVTAYINHLNAGVGGEVEVSRRSSNNARIGARMSLAREADGGFMTTFGARLHVVDEFYLAADIMNDAASPNAADIGFGAGFEGSSGAVVGIAELVLGALFVLTFNPGN